MAACPLPEVDTGVTISCLTLHRGPFIATDPLKLSSRPPETVVLEALKLLRKDRVASIRDQTTVNLDALQDDSGCKGVAIGYMGIFDESGLQTLERLCAIAKVKRDVLSETEWITKNRDGLTNQQMESLKKAFQSYHPEKAISVHEGFAVSVRSLTYFAQERY